MDELATVAWRRGRRLIIAAAVLVGICFGTGVGLSNALRSKSVLRQYPTTYPQTPYRQDYTTELTFHFTPLTLWIALGATVVGALVAYALLTRNSQGSAAVPTAPAIAPEMVETDLAEAIALASGSQIKIVYQVAAPGPNVAAIPGKTGHTVVFTSGAGTALERDELEALCAAQMAVLVDRHARILTSATDRLRSWRLLSVLGFVVCFILLVVSMKAAVPVVGIEVGFLIAAWFLGPRLRFWAGTSVDAKVVTTTNNPQALMSALPKVAAWNGPRVHAAAPWGFLGLVDRFWLVPVGQGFAVTRNRSNGTTSYRSAEMEDDIALLVRAQLVRKVVVEHQEPTLTSYKQTKAVLRMAGNAGAAGFSVPVDGVEVGPQGVVTAGQDDHSRLLAAKAASRQAQRAGVPPTVAGPGWYPDPAAPNAEWRWWDGREWTPYWSAPPARPNPT